MIARWADNVSSWLELQQEHGEDAIKIVRFEDLDLDFEKTVAELAAFMGRPITEPVRPVKDHDVNLARERETGAWRSVLSADDLAFIEAEAGALMRRLGYPES